MRSYCDWIQPMREIRSEYHRQHQYENMRTAATHRIELDATHHSSTSSHSQPVLDTTAVAVQQSLVMMMMMMMGNDIQR